MSKMALRMLYQMVPFEKDVEYGDFPIGKGVSLSSKLLLVVCGTSLYCGKWCYTLRHLAELQPTSSSVLISPGIGSQNVAVESAQISGWLGQQSIEMFVTFKIDLYFRLFVFLRCRKLARRLNSFSFAHYPATINLDQPFLFRHFSRRLVWTRVCDPLLCTHTRLTFPDLLFNRKTRGGWQQNDHCRHAGGCRSHGQRCSIVPSQRVWCLKIAKKSLLDCKTLDETKGMNRKALKKTDIAVPVDVIARCGHGLIEISIDCRQPSSDLSTGDPSKALSNTSILSIVQRFFPAPRSSSVLALIKGCVFTPRVDYFLRCPAWSLFVGQPLAEGNGANLWQLSPVEQHMTWSETNAIGSPTILLYDRASTTAPNLHFFHSCDCSRNLLDTPRCTDLNSLLGDD